MTVIETIARLFDEHGDRLYDSARSEPVSAREHAMQCAQLAEWAGARPGLVAAAFLHDVGHFLIDDPGSDDVDDTHELRALPLLSEAFGSDVVEPVRLHVAAKRYLVATDPDYRAALSPASIHSLRLQGGPMSIDEVDAFAALTHAHDAIALRRWDDLAKVPGRATPAIGYWLALLDEVRAAN